MLNENISDLHDIIPSLGIIKIDYLLKDLYKKEDDIVPLNSLEMMKILVNLDDKYTTLDKIILLIFCTREIDNYRIEEEEIEKKRIHPDDLNEQEKDEKITKIMTTKVVIETNIGTLVIGYDYAYIRKQEYTPNIEISESEQKIIDNKNIVYNIHYPYCLINNHDMIISLYKDDEQYTINMKTKECKQIKKKNKLEYNEQTDQKVKYNSQEIKEYKMTDSFMRKEKKLICNYEREKQSEELNEIQIVLNNDYSLDVYSNGIRERNYFVNYEKDK